MFKQMTLVDSNTAQKWDSNYTAGSAKSVKKYPNLDLVRLEKWYFKSTPGRLLEYAFGSGENLIHLLECGYVVDGIDASQGAKNFTERRISEHPELVSRAVLRHLPADATRLPYPDDCFDYVNCLSVLSLLGSKERVQYLLQEFARVMKSGAKMIVDINSPRSDFAHYAVYKGDDIYETTGLSGKEQPHLSYCPKNEATFVELVKPFFIVDDVGYSAHKYLHSEIHEFIICARKP